MNTLFTRDPQLAGSGRRSPPLRSGHRYNINIGVKTHKKKRQH